MFVAFLVFVLVITNLPSTDKRIVELLSEHDVKAQMTDRGVAIFMPTVIFKFGSSKLSDESKSVISGVIKVINLHSLDHKIAYFEGHTDEAGADEFNYKLGLDRANKVKKEFEKAGLSSTRALTVSYGSDIPVSDNDALNRRVEIVLVNKS